MCHALCGSEADNKRESTLLRRPRQLKPATLMVGYKAISSVVLLISLSIMLTLRINVASELGIFLRSVLHCVCVLHTSAYWFEFELLQVQAQKQLAVVLRCLRRYRITHHQCVVRPDLTVHRHRCCLPRPHPTLPRHHRVPEQMKQEQFVRMKVMLVDWIASHRFC